MKDGKFTYQWWNDKEEMFICHEASQNKSEPLTGFEHKNTVKKETTKIND